MTTKQVEQKLKTVTRRLGWRFAKVGDVIQAVEKCRGLPKGAHVRRLHLIRVKSVRFEPVSAVTLADVRREGFPDMTVNEFVAMFCEHHGCPPAEEVTRIAFEYI